MKNAVFTTATLRAAQAIHFNVKNTYTMSKYPVIRKGDIEVLSLKVEGGASLTLLPQVRLFAVDVEISDSCKGCQEWNIIEGIVNNTTAYSAKQ
jgi:hypothetical protein